MTSVDYVATRIKAAPSVALIAHVAPDGDTLGSALALSLALDALGIAHDVYCQDEGPRSCQDVLPAWQTIRKPDAAAPVYPLAIALDVSDHDRMGDCAALFDAAQERIVVDHHMTNPGFAQHNLLLDYAATGHIVLCLIDALGVALSADIALCLYVAIASDTGNFNFSNTTGDTLRACARLIDAGVDVADITQKLFRQRTRGKTLLIGHAIHGMQFHEEGKIALLFLRLDDFIKSAAGDGESENIVNFGIECEGVQVSIFARETQRGRIKVSFRSNGAVDVGTLAASLGGGGHARASGVSLEGDIEAVAGQVLAVVREHLPR